jgi:hypothetical protein
MEEFVLSETIGSAEPGKGEAASGSDRSGVSVFREGERAKMARSLERLLRTARREVRRQSAPSLIRLKWVNTVCYLTQTYNSLLRDTEVDELKLELSGVQERLRKLTQPRYQQH